jgi:hypothetical protein
VLAVAGVAIAQYALPQVTLTGTITPTKGGTKKKPKNATLTATFNVNKESRSTVSRITYLLPKNAKVSGKGFRFCPASQINNNGVGSCPKGSQVGTGSATALLGPQQTPIQFSIKVFAGSANEIALALSGSVPAPAFRGIISNAGGSFGQKITVDVPATVQQPIKGLYSYITSVTAKLGGVKGSTGKGKKKKTTYFVAVTGCPSGDKSHHYGVNLDLTANPNPPQTGQITAQDTSACKP